MRHFPGPRPAPAPDTGTSKTSSALAARRTLARRACQRPSSNGPPAEPRLRAPRQPCPRQSDLPTSRYQIWLPLMLLFWKPGRLLDFQTARAYSVHQQPQQHTHIHMRAPSTMCRPRFWCPTVHLHRRRGQQRHVLGAPDRDAVRAGPGTPHPNRGKLTTTTSSS